MKSKSHQEFFGSDSQCTCPLFWSQLGDYIPGRSHLYQPLFQSQINNEKFCKFCQSVVTIVESKQEITNIISQRYSNPFVYIKNEKNNRNLVVIKKHVDKCRQHAYSHPLSGQIFVDYESDCSQY